jgi:hypothetical protein
MTTSGKRARLIVRVEEGVEVFVETMRPEHEGALRIGPCVPVVRDSGPVGPVVSGPTPAPPVPKVMSLGGDGGGDGGGDVGGGGSGDKGGGSTGSPPSPSAPGNFRWNAAGCRGYDPPAPGNGLCHGK